MKKKLKLAFAELEKEMEVLTRTDQSFVIGGTSSYSIDYYIDYYVKQLGFGVDISEDGNSVSFINPNATDILKKGTTYYFWDEESKGLKKGKWEGNATTIGYIPTDNNNDPFNPNLNYDPYASSNSFETTAYNTSTGNPALDHYNEMIARANMLSQFRNQFPGYDFNPYVYEGDTGSIDDPYSYDPYNALLHPGPWTRDGNGNLVKTPTGNALTKIGIGDNKFDLQEVTIKTTGGVSITAYKVTAVYDSEENLLYSGDDIPDRFKSECKGYAFAGGDVWITDFSGTDGINQMATFEDLLSNSGLYTEVPKAQANTVVVWSSYQGIIHSGEYNAATDTYTWKNNQGDVRTGSFEVFSETFDSGIPIKYYKSNY